MKEKCLKLKLANDNKMSFKADFKKYSINILIFITTLILITIFIEVAISSVYPINSEKIFLQKPANINTSYNIKTAWQDYSNFDSIVGWTDYKNSKYIHKSLEYNAVVEINNEGYRDDEWQIEKTNDEIRIIALGDSFTHAYEVNKNFRFTEILENLLNQNSSNKFSVMNFGMQAYATCQQYFVLVNKALKYKPDVVLLFFHTGNDFFENNDDWVNRPKCSFNDNGLLINFTKPKFFHTVSSHNTKTNIFSILHKTNLGVLFLNFIKYSPLTHTFAKIFGLKQHVYILMNLLNVKTQEANKPFIKKTFNMLKGTDTLLKEKNIPFYVFIIPQKFQVENSTWHSLLKKYDFSNEEYNPRLINDLIIEYLQKENIENFDLYDSLYEESIKGKKVFFEYDGHYSHHGHEITAQKIFKFLQKSESFNKINKSS